MGNRSSRPNRNELSPEGLLIAESYFDYFDRLLEHNLTDFLNANRDRPGIRCKDLDLSPDPKALKGLCCRNASTRRFDDLGGVVRRTLEKALPTLAYCPEYISNYALRCEGCCPLGFVWAVKAHFEPYVVTDSARLAKEASKATAAANGDTKTLRLNRRIYVPYRDDWGRRGYSSWQLRRAIGVSRARSSIISSVCRWSCAERGKGKSSVESSAKYEKM